MLCEKEITKLCWRQKKLRLRKSNKSSREKRKLYCAESTKNSEKSNKSMLCEQEITSRAAREGPCEKGLKIYGAKKKGNYRVRNTINVLATQRGCGIAIVCYTARKCHPYPFLLRARRPKNCFVFFAVRAAPEELFCCFSHKYKVIPPLARSARRSF